MRNDTSILLCVTVRVCESESESEFVCMEGRKEGRRSLCCHTVIEEAKQALSNPYAMKGKIK